MKYLKICGVTAVCGIYDNAVAGISESGQTFGCTQLCLKKDRRSFNIHKINVNGAYPFNPFNFHNL